MEAHGRAAWRYVMCITYLYAALCYIRINIIINVENIKEEREMRKYVRFYERGPEYKRGTD